MNTLEAYRLRMALVDRGFIPCPMRDSKAVYVPHNICLQTGTNHEQYISNNKELA